MNRITAAIGRAEDRIKAKLDTGEVTQARVDEMHRDMDLDLEEYVKFQGLKSLACMNGKGAGGLSLEEATTVYGFLGETVGHFNRQRLAVKSTLTNLFAELLAQRIKAKRGR